MMQGQFKPFSQFTTYVSSQIERINIALQNQGQMTSKIEMVFSTLKKHQGKFDEIQNKLSLIDVYQSQNFRNNERIYKSLQNYDLLDKKLMLLEDMKEGIVACIDERIENKGQNQHVSDLQTRIKDIEVQMEKLKSKNAVMAKFKRQIAPSIPNAQSTKDISIQHSSHNHQFKKIQKKLLQELNQKIKVLDKKYSLLLSQAQRSTNEEIYDDFQSVRKTRAKDNSYLSPKQPRRQMLELRSQDRFHQKINNYYNQVTQKDQMIKNKGKGAKKSGSKKLKKQSKSKSKSKKDLSLQKSLSLNTVNQYLKINQKKL